ncbi:hypothetical protein Q4Q35_04790 [Flavivirga aquimarina]|uniref:DUF4178 domain-containing protein n=1 Tax=Flavivirga aquimarina TaxID=2027862 RepID=A0ABT8W7L6_9FLAO|nr:hypothetical protein [Flavivirga aquimarina]MDO5969118.1 hypothetical protein [Flavivirga aquimarina]
MEALVNILTIKNTIDGIWINNNKNTKNTVKIIISNNGKNVQVYGKYNQKDYSWGTKILTPEINSTNMYWTVFHNIKAKYTFIFTIDNDKMEVRYEQDYKSPSKETKWFTENLTKLNLYEYESVVASKPIEIVTPSTIELEGTPLQEPDSAPILCLDDLTVDHDLESLYNTTNIKERIKPKTGIFNYLPSYGIYKWMLGVSTLIGAYLKKVRHTVSIRKLMSLQT